LNQRLPEAYQIRSGLLDLELWGRWDRTRFSELEGGIALTGLELERVRETEGAELESLSLEHLDGDFRWRRRPDGWLLQADSIDVARGGSRWPTGRMALRARNGEPGGSRYDGGIDFLRLDDVAAIAAMLPLPERAARVLQAIRPQAELHDLRLRITTGDGTPAWSARGRIGSLYTRPWQRVPGVENLDTEFWLDQDQGTLRLDSEGPRLRFPRLFRDPLALQRLMGDLHWNRLPQGGWRIATPWLLAVTDDIRTQTRLEMRFPQAPDRSPTMDLQTDFRDGRAANAGRYYPVAIMPPAVVKWLDRGIVDGRVTAGSARVVGPLRDFPFDVRNTGQFQVLFDVEGMTLDYWPGWPRLTGVAGRIRFFDNRFDAWIDAGRIFDSRLEQAHGRIEALKGGAPFQLEGVVTGPLQDDLRLLRESPLAEDFAHLTSGMGARGRTRMELELAVPLRHGDRFRLDGALRFQDSTLLLNDWKLPLERIRGVLRFDRNSVSGRGISAAAMGSPVQVDLETIDGDPKSTRITASGSFGLDQLGRPFGLDPPPWISGSSPWRIRLDIPHDQKRRPRPTLLRADSNLVGTRIDLPPPVGKEAMQQRPFRISTGIGTSTRGLIEARYGDILDARVALDPDAGGRLQRAGIRIGGGEARLPEQPGIEIDGRLAELDLEAWSTQLEQESPPAELPAIRRLRLSIDRALLGDLQLRRLALDLDRQADGLEGTIAARRFRGRLSIPDQPDEPLRARLEYLKLVFTGDGPDAATAATGKRPPPPEPDRLPSLDLGVERVTVNGEEFGTLQLITRRRERGIELQQLSLNSPLLHLSAAGLWQRELSGRHRSSVDLSLSTESLGRLTRALGLDPVIERAPAEIEGRLHWNGSPLDFSPATLGGSLSLQLGRGVLVNTRPGLGRILGLLDIASLQRRLSLDFSDVTGRGFGFDAIEGSFTLEDGDAYTSDLLIRSPSARVEFVGRIGLADEDLDQLVTITPNVSATLPLAGALAGGPVGAAAMVLAQGVLGKQFNKIARRQYRIDGSWDDPAIIPIRRRVESAEEREGDIALGAGETTPPASAAPSPASPRQPSSKGLLGRFKQRFRPTGETPSLTPDR
ncbi:MAG TPA: TIGR02099 family protein, partial [Sedimenticola thiotaurini]|nr:TIGR02099 family protein [Sedimenticola thiotaurini]